MKLREIFKRKAKEISDKISQAEKIIDDCQRRLNDLKSAKSSELLRKEIIELVEKLKCESFHWGRHINYDGESDERQEKIKELKDEILEVFDACASLKNNVNGACDE